jgi:hypothetical protein
VVGEVDVNGGGVGEVGDAGTVGMPVGAMGDVHDPQLHNVAPAM